MTAPRHRPAELAPVNGPERLGDDLGDHQNQKREESREQSHPLTAEHPGRLRSGKRRPQGVGDRIQGQDGADCIIDSLGPQLQKDARPLIPLVGLLGESGVARRQECCLQQRAQEGDTDRDGDVDDE